MSRPKQLDELDLGLGEPLALTDEAVARMTGSQRKVRVEALMAQSRDFLSATIDQHITREGKKVAAVVGLFSGGNDSTTLIHMFRDRLDYAAHANTTVGIEETRDFVRNTCEEWGLPLIERKPPRQSDRYRALVLRYGFPGPASHFAMYRNLKERALVQIRRELVSNPRAERVLFMGGIRRAESQRRSRRDMAHREGSIVWVSPLINWTKLDLNTYRLMAGDVPRNKASDLIHMSGECLCGSFAAPGERAEIDHWFPLALAEVRELESLLTDRSDIPTHRKTWGWGADPALKALDGAPSKTGLLCSSCDTRFQATLDLGEIA